MRILTILMSCLFVKVRGELSTDVVYSLLKSRLESIELETHGLKSSIEDMSDRMDQFEEMLRQMQTNKKPEDKSDENENNVRVESVHGNGTIIEIDEAFKETIIKSLNSEKGFIRKAVTRHERMFAQLKRTFYYQLQAMNASIEATAERMDEDMNTHVEYEKAMDQLKSGIDKEVKERFVKLITTFNSTVDRLEATISDQRGVLASPRFGGQVLDRDVRSMLDSVNSLEERHVQDIDSIQSSVNSLVGRLRGDISNLKDRMDSLTEDKRIGFTARLESKLRNIAPNKIIVFDNVVSNYGSGYSDSTGEFTAQISGLYLFQFNVEAYGYLSNVHAALYVDGYYKVSARAEINLTGSNTAVAYMSQGDKAYVKTANVDVESYSIYPYRTSFTGVLIG